MFNNPEIYRLTQETLEKETTHTIIREEIREWESCAKILYQLAIDFLTLEQYDLAFRMSSPLEKASEYLAKWHIAAYLEGVENEEGMFYAFRTYPKIQLEENFIIPRGIAAFGENVPLYGNVSALQIIIEKEFVDHMNKTFKSLLEYRKELGLYIDE